MGRKVTKGAVKQPIVCKKKTKCRSPVPNITDTSLKDGIPTLWSGKEITYQDCFPFCLPKVGVTPESAEDSDVEVSEPTLNYFLEGQNEVKLSLSSHAEIKDSSVHRQRRFMYGNSRVPMQANITTSSVPNVIKSWYSNAAGYNNYDDVKYKRSPVIAQGRLVDITGVYIFCPAKAEGNPPLLRFLRAPVDFSHNCETAALYGLTEQESIITRSSEWSLLSA